MNKVYKITSEDRDAFIAEMGIDVFAECDGQFTLDESTIEFYITQGINLNTICNTLFSETFEERYGAISPLENMVTADPDNAYRIYKYILPDKEENLPSVTVPPLSIDYTIDVNPKLQKRTEIIDEQGSLVYVEWWAYTEDGLTPIEEVLKVNIEYTYADDADNNTAKTVLSRKVTRQWILENGTYKSWTEGQIAQGLSDLKVRIKHYPDYRTRKTVGKARRDNVIALGEEKFVTLVTILIAGGNQQLAENIGNAILGKYTDEYNLFYNTGKSAFMEGILNDNDTEVLLDPEGNPIIPGLSSKAVLDAVVPPAPFTVNIGYGPMTFNQIVPNSEGLSLRQFISEKYRGNI